MQDRPLRQEILRGRSTVSFCHLRPPASSTLFEESSKTPYPSRMPSTKAHTTTMHRATTVQIRLAGMLDRNEVNAEDCVNFVCMFNRENCNGVPCTQMSTCSTERSGPWQCTNVKSHTGVMLSRLRHGGPEPPYISFVSSEVLEK